MNKTRKILFFDIDGTLITDDGKRYFPDSAKEAIQKARENGHLAFINTGRVFCNVTEEIRSAGFDGFGGLSNGARSAFAYYSDHLKRAV